MALGWYGRLRQAERLEARRERKLTRNLQRAGALALRPAVLAEPTWGRRFGAAMRLRAVGGVIQGEDIDA